MGNVSVDDGRRMVRVSERQASLEEKRTANVAIMWEKEVADLRAKLEAAEQDKENLLQDYYARDREVTKYLNKVIELQQDRDDLQAANVVLVDVLKEADKRLAAAYKTMNWFASGESMKEYRKIEPADILVEVYQGLAPLVTLIQQALAGNGEDTTPMQPAPLKQYKASLQFYGIKETVTIEAENMKEAEKELVQWVGTG